MRKYISYLLLICILILCCSCGKKDDLAYKQAVTTTPVETVSPLVQATNTPRNVSTPQALALSIYTPTPTPSPIPTPSPTPLPFLGQWAYSFEGTEIILKIESDGTGIISYMDNQQPFTWSYSEDKLTLTGLRSHFTASLSQGSISIDTADGTLVFAEKE